MSEQKIVNLVIYKVTNFYTENKQPQSQNLSSRDLSQPALSHQYPSKWKSSSRSQDFQPLQTAYSYKLFHLRLELEMA